MWDQREHSVHPGGLEKLLGAPSRTGAVRTMHCGALVPL